MATNAELIRKAAALVRPKKVKGFTMADVGCALVSGKGKVYYGVCIDMGSGMGFCAEPNAIGSMVTAGEYRIKKIVAVWKDEKGDVFVVAPCGKCREFMRQIDEENLYAEVLLEKNKAIKLKDLLPYHNSYQRVK